MKHPLSVTLLLIGLFVAAQLVGLFLVDKSIVAAQSVNGTIVLEHSTTAIGDRPNLVGWESFLYLLGGVLIGTALLLLLIRFRKVKLWKFWFFLAVFLSTAVAFGVLLPQLIALALALALALLKVYWPNPWVHNFSELFIYAGIAVLLVPIFDVFWMVIVLLAISLYDMIAVWRTKHMVTMAQFQSKSEVFAGLMIPKHETQGAATVTPPAAHEPASATSRSAKLRPTTTKITAAGAKLGVQSPPSPPSAPATGSHAVLGGGDVAFPMLFTGAVLEGLVRSGLTKTAAFSESLIVIGFAAIALALLLLFAKKDRFYPAMPFLTAGCLLGWVVTMLI